MLTRLRIKNFKPLENVDIELGQNVVFVGPNNSGKTAALQALTLWDLGLRKWNERYAGKTAPAKRPGITINRRELLYIPVPTANMLWRNLDTRSLDRTEAGQTQHTKPAFIDIVVEGVTREQQWKCGLEFYYANPESLYCRPLRVTENGSDDDRMPIPEEASEVQVALLPPMSGLSAEEPIWEPGRINVLLGEGRTAEVLRNLCHKIYENNQEDWNILCGHMRELFGVDLTAPNHIAERGEIVMGYTEHGGKGLDISCAGRGVQQTLLLLSYLYTNPGAVLLLDEPDAHLEILRQREIYNLITRIAAERGGQVIAATHSEVILNEAGDRDIVVAFLGRRPHRIDNSSQRSQVLKSLKEIGFQEYYQAAQKGWVLYLEGATDLAILHAFAETLAHDARAWLERPFVHYVGNLPSRAHDHFYGIRESNEDLVGIAIFDHMEDELCEDTALRETMWERREIENYLCYKEVLMLYATHGLESNLFDAAKAREREQAMTEAIDEIESALQKLRGLDPWSADIKASDDFLDPLFQLYFNKLDLPNQLRKSSYHVLARIVPREMIDKDVVTKLDAIVAVAEKATRASSR